ncbi:MAG: hypothetical protein PF517_22605 [Salinivirgaceae bacterium]|jgi:hypothetical protein|nr:hypothetical protein [Salinivirgaceae bacterium]
MKTTLKSLILLIALAISFTAKAEEKSAMDTMPVQLSFITPIGTNGMQSWNTVNNFSLNMYAGYSGGLDGFEASGFVSVLRGDMKGVQFSGFVNADMGKTKGAQFAGFVNYNKEELEGAQLAGFVNAVTNNTDAIQGAGFVNLVVGELEGAQFAGFVNVATKESKGAQFSGFLNAVTDSLDGFQGTGFVNYAMGSSMGQASGFLNANVGDLKGIQASGFLNVNTGRLNGAQLSGFVNFSNKLRGTQIGVFNYVDSLESGTPIGFLSFVRNGYHAFEISSSETLNGIATFKTGTKKFYNIISVGGGVRGDKILWGWGYGVGTTMELSRKFDLAVEVQSFHINEDVWHTNRLNLWNKLTLETSYQVTPRLEVFGGPTFNVVVSDTKDEIGEPRESSIAPFTSFSKVYSDGSKVEMYPGFNVGIRF